MREIVLNVFGAIDLFLQPIIVRRQWIVELRVCPTGNDIEHDVLSGNILTDARHQTCPRPLVFNQFFVLLGKHHKNVRTMLERKNPLFTHFNVNGTFFVARRLCSYFCWYFRFIRKSVGQIYHVHIFTEMCNNKISILCYSTKKRWKILRVPVV